MPTKKNNKKVRITRKMYLDKLKKNIQYVFMMM